MIQKRWLAVFCAEGAVCAGLTLLLRGSSLFDAGIFAFPFAQLGAGLRALSLMGGGWNVLAIVLYALLALLPMAGFVYAAQKKRLHTEELLLPLLSVTLFAVLYAMINPSQAERYFSMDRSFASALLGAVVYTQCIAYAVLRLLRTTFSADADGLRRCFRAVLLVLAAFFVYCAFGAQLHTLLADWKTLAEGNTAGAVGNLAGGRSLRLTQFFLLLRYLAEAAPYLLDVWVILAALELLSARMKADAASAADAAGQIARRCRISLSVSVLTELTLDVLQALAAGKLLNTAFSVKLPLISIAFCLAALLLVRLMQENRRLRDDNDLFI